MEYSDIINHYITVMILAGMFFNNPQSKHQRRERKTFLVGFCIELIKLLKKGIDLVEAAVDFTRIAPFSHCSSLL